MWALPTELADGRAPGIFADSAVQHQDYRSTPPCLDFHRDDKGLQQTPYQLNHLPRYKHLALLLFSKTGSHAAQEQAEGQNDLRLNLFSVHESFACMKHLHHVHACCSQGPGQRRCLISGNWNYRWLRNHWVWGTEPGCQVQQVLFPAGLFNS